MAVDTFKVGSVSQYRKKLVQANRRISIAGVRSLSGLPTDQVDFPPVQVIVDMWRIVQSGAARASSMSEVFAG